MKSRNGFGLPKYFGYHSYGKKKFYFRAMFAQSYFALPVNHNTLHHCFAWTFDHFTSLPILEGAIIRKSNYEYNKYFSIYTRRKSGVAYDRKIEKHPKKKGETC